MALKLSAAASGSAVAAANHTVFIDTSLDTHLAMVVSDLDTVYDLKRKIEKEHTLCFTNIGQIVVHALKVMRKRHLYHLPDFMFVKDALDANKKNWFLSVDASIVDNHNEKQLVDNPYSNNLLTSVGIVSNASADGVDLLLNAILEQGTIDPSKKSEVPQIRGEDKTDASKHDILERCNMLVEEASHSDQVAKEKCKIEHLQEKNVDSGKETTRPEIVSQKMNLSTKSDASKRDIIEQCNVLVEEASQSDQVVKEKRESEHLQEKSKETSKAEIVSQKFYLSTKSDASKHKILEQCNMLVEEASQSDQVSKRKRKVEHLQEENIGSVIEISKPETVSQNHLGDERKSENASLDGLTAKPMDDDNQVINSTGRKKKKKKGKKSGNELNQVAAGVLSSEENVLGERNKVTSEVDNKDSGGELDTASLPVQGEHGTTPLEICKIITKEKRSDIIQEAGKYLALAGDVGSKSNATVGEATCAANKAGNSKNHCPADVESNPPLADGQQMDDGVSGHKKSGTDQAERAAEERALSKKGKMSNEPDLHSQDTTGVNIQNVNVTADLLGESGTVVPTNSSKRRKKTRKTKDPIGKTLVTSDREDIQGSEPSIILQPLEANSGEQPGNKARKEESNLTQRNEKEGFEMNTENTLLAEENVAITGNEVKTTQQTSEQQGKGENAEKQVRKESKRKRKSSEKNLPDSQLEDGNIVDQSSTRPPDNKGEVVASSNAKKKGRSEKPALKAQLNEEKPESKNLGVGIDPVPAQPNSEFAKSTKVQSHSLDQSQKARPVEANLTVHPPESGYADEANNQIEVPEISNKINLEKHLPVEKMTIAKRAANIRNSKNIKNDVHSDGTSSLQSSLKSNDKQGIEGKHPARNSSIVPLQGSPSRDKYDESAVRPEKKQPKASRGVTKAIPSDVSGKLNSIPEDTRRHNVANVAGTNIHPERSTDSVSVSKSGSQISRIMSSQNIRGDKQRSGVDSNRAVDGKVSNMGNGKIVNSSEHQKKVIAKPGSIFKDDDSGSSEDEEVDGSDASTRTPSDHLSSDYSDGESNANMNSPRNGSFTAAKTKSEGRNATKSCSSSAKDMAFDAILRSSSRFKKAKLTASQLHLDDESQKVDFVPDSQANQ